MIQRIFFTLAWKRGVGSNYFFPNRFSDLIVSWEQECGNGRIWAQTSYFHGDGIVGMGSLVWEHFGGIPHGAWDNYVFGTLFFLKVGTGAYGWERGVRSMGILIFLVVCFQT